MKVRVLPVAGTALLLLASACGSSGSAKPAARAPSGGANAAGDRAVVAFVGDSNISLDGRWLVWDLTRGTGGLLTANHLDDNYVPVFIARSGAGIRTPDCPARDTSCRTDDFWTRKLDTTFADVRPNVVVTDLGINDAFMPGRATTPGYVDYAAKVAYFMSLMPKSTFVIWTNLPCAIEPVTLRTGCDDVDQALGAAKAHWRNLSVLDWASVADKHRFYMDRDAPPSLRVHYSDQGDRAWAALVTRALDNHFPM